MSAGTGGGVGPSPAPRRRPSSTSTWTTPSGRPSRARPCCCWSAVVGDARRGRRGEAPRVARADRARPRLRGRSRDGPPEAAAARRALPPRLAQKRGARAVETRAHHPRSSLARSLSTSLHHSQPPQSNPPSHPLCRLHIIRVSPRRYAHRGLALTATRRLHARWRRPSRESQEKGCGGARHFYREFSIWGPCWGPAIGLEPPCAAFCCNHVSLYSLGWQHFNGWIVKNSRTAVQAEQKFHVFLTAPRGGKAEIFFRAAHEIMVA